MTLKNRRKLALETEIGSNRRQRKCCGILHARITRFLPDFIDDGDQYANLRRISIVFNITYQAVYKWMKPGRANRITPAVAQALVELSNMTEKRPSEDWRPAQVSDFWEFVV